MKKLNVALFGLGRFGKNYARLLSEMKRNVKFRAIVTATEKSRDSFTLPSSVIQTTNSSIVFNDKTIDAVVLVTPPSTHFELAKKSLESGKHVLVEKPMVLSLREAENLSGVVRDSKKVFMIGYQYVYNDHIRKVKKILEDNTKDKPKYMIMEHFLSPEPKDTDIFWEAGPHPLSIFQHIFNPTKILYVNGITRKDFVSAMIKFDRGPLLQIIASWRGEKKVRMLRIARENSLVSLDETSEKNKLIIADTGGKVIFPFVKTPEPLRNEVEHFIKCVGGNKTPLTNFDFGFKVTRWLHEISNEMTR